MKAALPVRLVAAVLALCFLSSPVLAADPPGPPDSAEAWMPSLREIEPRQLIESLPYTITNSGPYVITENLTGQSGQDGITIAASSVTIDLNGFALSGGVSTLDGIRVSGARTFIVIKNGVLNGWFGDGIDGTTASNCRLEDLLIVNSVFDGARLGANATIENCIVVGSGQDGFDVQSDSRIAKSTARSNGGRGFSAGEGCVITECIADDNTGDGFEALSVAQISKCTASGNSRGFDIGKCGSVVDSCAYQNWSGFHGWDGVVFSRCVAYENTYGIYAALSCSFSDCSAYSNTWQGIYGDKGAAIVNCTAYENHDGIGARNGSTIKDSACSKNVNGFWLGWSTSIEGCSAMNNSSNGIVTQSGSYVRNNTLRNNAFAGITSTDKCRIEDNQIVDCGRGIRLTGDQNKLSGNILLDNTTDYDLAADNLLDLVVAELPTTISWPASVTLAGSLKGVAGFDGIKVASSDVSIDLGGHTLVGVPGSYSGILVSGTGLTGVEVQNGTIQGWGQYGINLYAAKGTRVDGVNVYTNGYSGATYDGIRVGQGAVVKDCLSIGNKDDGIYVYESAVVSGCSASRNIGSGIYAYKGSTVQNCTVGRNGQYGIFAYYSSLIKECSSFENGADGIRVYYDSKVEGNVCDGNSSGSGVWGVYSDNSLDGNSVTDNGYGIRAGVGTLVVRNRASGNGTNYNLSASSTYGPQISGSGQITTTSPWANFSF